MHLSLLPSITCLGLSLAASLEPQGTVSRLVPMTETKRAPVLTRDGGVAGQQRIQCYDRTSQQGDSVIATDYMPYISAHNMNNRIESCCFSGIWILYGDEVYNGQNTQAHNFWAYGENYCTDMPQPFLNEASSLRYTGHPQDMFMDSINLYFNEYFMGDEEFAYNDSPVLNYDNRARSIIITGSSWWTIYEYSNYGGYKACLAPGSSGNPAFYGTASNLQQLSSDISSIAKGCFAKDIIYPDNYVVEGESRKEAAGTVEGFGFH